MDRRDWYFRQRVSQAELDDAHDKIELADQRLASEAVGFGFIITGPNPATVIENAIPDLQVQANRFLGYDQLGRRLSNALSGFLGGVDQGLPPQLANMAVDELGASTAVVTPGNEKTLSIFIEFERKLTDPRTDGNGATVFHKRDESIKFNVVQSAEAGLGLSVPPPLRPDQLLLADTVLIFGQTTILNAGIDQTRRQAFALATAHGNSHVETGADPIPNATGAVGGLLSAADKTVLDNTPQTASDHAALFNNQTKLNQRPDIVAAASTSQDVTGSMAGKVAGGTATKEGVVTQASAPNNIVEIRDTNFNQLLSAAGNRIFGEITVDDEVTPTVWTLSYFTYIAGTKTAFDMTPFAGPTLKWAVYETFNLENLPTFDLESLFTQNLDAGDIVAASASVAGKVKLITDGAATAADAALGTTDARTGAVKGRANAGAVTGFEQIVRLIGAGGLGVSLVQAAGEQQFTLDGSTVLGQGKVVQTVEAPLSGLVTIAAAAIPLDDTIPQNTEGVEVLTLAITPLSLSNKLRVKFHTTFGNTGGEDVVIALFRDSIADAIRAVGEFNSSTAQMVTGTLAAEFAVPSLSPQTYKIRMGIATFTAYINGEGGARRFGGVSGTTLIIEEIAPN